MTECRGVSGSTLPFENDFIVVVTLVSLEGAISGIRDLKRKATAIRTIKGDVLN
jgi:hypothetical protein